MATKTEQAVITDRTGNDFAAYAVLTTAAELLLRETEQQMQLDHLQFKHEQKRLVWDLQAAINRTKYLCERFTEEMAIASGGGAFDALLNDSNAAIVLLMRYYNAVHSKAENSDKIRAFMKDLQESELFPEELIQKFESRL